MCKEVCFFVHALITKSRKIGFAFWKLSDYKDVYLLILAESSAKIVIVLACWIVYTFASFGWSFFCGYLTILFFTKTTLIYFIPMHFNYEEFSVLIATATVAGLFNWWINCRTNNKYWLHKISNYLWNFHKSKTQIQAHLQIWDSNTYSNSTLRHKSVFISKSGDHGLKY